MLHIAIDMLGSTYYLWLRGTKDQETGEYQDWAQAWANDDLLEFSWFITEEEDKDAERVAYEDGQLVLRDPEEQGSVFGYIWCSRSGMQGRGSYKHGLVGMRYGWEKAADTVFKDASSTEFRWRLRVSSKIWSFMNYQSKKNAAPAGLQQAPKGNPLPEMPELFKTAISKLDFRQKAQRYLRKPTTKVCEAIVEEFASFEPERMKEIVDKLEGSGVLKKQHMAELFEEMQRLYYEVAPSEELADLPEGL